MQTIFYTTHSFWFPSPRSSKRQTEPQYQPCSPNGSMLRRVQRWCVQLDSVTSSQQSKITPANRTPTKLNDFKIVSNEIKWIPGVLKMYLLFNCTHERNLERAKHQNAWSETNASFFRSIYYKIKMSFRRWWQFNQHAWNAWNETRYKGNLGYFSPRRNIKNWWNSIMSVFISNHEHRLPSYARKTMYQITLEMNVV